MEECWNFHNFIAVPLEAYSRKYIGSQHTTANDIDSGAFVSAMLDVLLIVYGSFDDLVGFVDACGEYEGLSHHKIPEDVSKELFDDFRRLISIKHTGEVK